MGSHRLFSYGSEQTHLLGTLLASHLQHGDIVGLEGDLGAGKTSFVQGVGKGLHITSPHQVTSPTFALVNMYPADILIYHLDLYRIKSPTELYHMGIEDYLSEKAVFFLEWADRFNTFFDKTISLCFEHINPTSRCIDIKYFNTRGKSLYDTFLKTLSHHPQFLNSNNRKG